MKLSSRCSKLIGLALVLIAVGTLLASPATAAGAPQPRESQHADVAPAGPAGPVGLWQMWVRIWNELAIEVTLSAPRAVLDELVPGQEVPAGVNSCDLECLQKSGDLDPNG